MTTKNITTPKQALKAFPTVVELNKELKRTASIKCRLGKRYGSESKVAEVQAYEDILRQAKSLLNPSTKSVPNFTESDIEQLDWDGTQRALKSIQSKKSNSKYLTATPCDNDTYRDACRVEQLLLEHKATLEPGSSTRIAKSTIADIISRCEADPDLNAIDQLKALL